MSDGHAIGAGWPPCPCCSVRPQMRRIDFGFFKCDACGAAMNAEAFRRTSVMRGHIDDNWGIDSDDIWHAAVVALQDYDGPSEWRLTDE